MIVVSFYTRRTIYEQAAEKLRASVKKLGLKYDITKIRGQGNWRAHVGYKPKFLLQMLDKHQKPVMWVDADDMMVGKPKLLLNKPYCDIAYPVHFELRNTEVPCTAVLYFANTANARGILKSWIEMEEKLDYNSPKISRQGIDLTTFTEVIFNDNSYWALHAARLILPITYLRFAYKRKFSDMKNVVIDHYNMCRHKNSGRRWKK